MAGIEKQVKKAVGGAKSGGKKGKKSGGSTKLRLSKGMIGPWVGRHTPHPMHPVQISALHPFPTGGQVAAQNPRSTKGR